MQKRRGGFPGASLAEKRRQVRAFQASGLTRGVFCVRAGISRSSLSRWCRQIEAADKSVVGHGKRPASPVRERPSFAEVRVEGRNPEAESPSPSPYRVAIHLSSGDRLLLPEACDPRWVGQVVRALRSGQC
jgi:hypothetical protein